MAVHEEGQTLGDMANTELQIQLPCQLHHKSEEEMSELLQADSLKKQSHTDCAYYFKCKKHLQVNYQISCSTEVDRDEGEGGFLHTKCKSDGDDKDHWS